MKTVMEMLTDHASLLPQDTRKTVKELVLEQDDSAKCIDGKKEGYKYIIYDGFETLGYGDTKEEAWASASRYLLFGTF